MSKCSFNSVVGESEETLVARNEVCLAVYFENDAVITVCGDLGCDNTICSNTTRFLSCLHSASFSQVVNRFFDIAIRFRKRFLTIHHAKTRALAQIFYHCRSYISHELCLYFNRCESAMRRLSRSCRGLFDGRFRQECPSVFFK